MQLLLSKLPSSFVTNFSPVASQVIDCFTEIVYIIYAWITICNTYSSHIYCKGYNRWRKLSVQTWIGKKTCLNHLNPHSLRFMYLNITCDIWGNLLVILKKPNVSPPFRKKSMWELLQLKAYWRKKYLAIAD